MKTSLIVAVVAIAAALLYQFTLVTPGYEKESRYQYDDMMRALRLYGETSKSGGVVAVVAEIADSVAVDMGKMRPPVWRIPWHILFTRSLNACRRALDVASVVGGATAADEAVAGCARALLPLR